MQACTDNSKELLAIAECFSIDGEIISVEPYGEGHINSTFLVTTDKKKYILQKINNSVFKKPEDVMENIFFVTRFLKKQGEMTLNVVNTATGALMKESKGKYYRVYDFIEDSFSYQIADDPEVFKNAGEAFGKFQKCLEKFDATILNETIPHFHDTPKRFRDFSKSYEQDICDRLKTCKEEAEFILSRKNTYGKITDAINEGTVPQRVTHNDTKLNNILMDPKTKKAIAIIDLDTVMPGSMLYDFGDSIRFGANTAAEDEKDLDKVHFNIEMFKSYAEGFCGAVGSGITETEKELLPYSAYLMTMECGMRFLADYLAGDTYFATKYPEHNLVRCRTQLKLAKEMEEAMDKMRSIIDECF